MFEKFFKDKYYESYNQLSKAYTVFEKVQEVSEGIKDQVVLEVRNTNRHYEMKEIWEKEIQKFRKEVATEKKYNDGSVEYKVYQALYEQYLCKDNLTEEMKLELASQNIDRIREEINKEHLFKTEGFQEAAGDELNRLQQEDFMHKFHSIKEHCQPILIKKVTDESKVYRSGRLYDDDNYYDYYYDKPLKKFYRVKMVIGDSGSGIAPKEIEELAFEDLQESGMKSLARLNHGLNYTEEDIDNFYRTILTISNEREDD